MCVFFSVYSQCLGEAVLGEGNQFLVSGSTDVQPNRKQSLESSYNQRCLHGITIASLLHLLSLLVRHCPLWTGKAMCRWVLKLDESNTINV